MSLYLMDSNYYQPSSSSFQMKRPEKISDKGNLYKVQITHGAEDGQAHKYEIWTTHEAVQKHFKDMGMAGMPESYQVQKFARHVYDEQLRKPGGQQPVHKGIFVSTTGEQHGNPHLWPHSLNDSEIKYS